MTLTNLQFHRYARHLILDEVGEEGQEKLIGSRVLVVGAGGLGAPILMYLAAAGVGTLGIVDDDAVDLTNLQRQIIHSTANVGTAKVKSAIESLAAINPEVRVTPHHLRLTAENARGLIAEYDLVCDGSDNFATRYVLNDACYFEKKPLVAASLLRFEGQMSTFKAYDGKTPCYRCLFREPPPTVLMLTTTFSPTAMRPSRVAEPICGSSTTLSSSSSFGSICGSRAYTSSPAPAISRA